MNSFSLYSADNTDVICESALASGALVRAVTWTVLEELEPIYMVVVGAPGNVHLRISGYELDTA